MNEYMKEAIEEARIGITEKHGGPFGAVIVKDGIIIARNHNHVLKNNDPSCHGEIAAIRDAGRYLKTYDLSECELYVTGEPCPMCLCACMWANIKKVYYGCTLKDNEMIGFRDNVFDDKLGGRKKLKGYLECIDRDECLKLFEEYNSIKDRVIY